MPKRNRDVLQRELFPARVKADRHRGADAKTCQQIIVRIGPGIAAACAHRFISDKTMLTRSDFLLETIRAAAHDDLRSSIMVFCGHNPESGTHNTRKRVAVAPD